MAPSEELLITADHLDQCDFNEEWVRVFWPHEQAWNYAKISDFNDITGMCTTVYESGMQSSLFWLAIRH